MRSNGEQKALRCCVRGPAPPRHAVRPRVLVHFSARCTHVPFTSSSKLSKPHQQLKVVHTLHLQVASYGINSRARHSIAPTRRKPHTPSPAVTVQHPIRLHRSNQTKEITTPQRPSPLPGSQPQPSNNGHPPPRAERHPANPARQPREPARELLYEVLPVPRPVVAPAVLRRRRRLAPPEDALRLPQDRRLRPGQDGGGARRRRPARSHHLAQRHADAPEVRYRGEAHAPEP